MSEITFTEAVRKELAPTGTSGRSSTSATRCSPRAPPDQPRGVTVAIARALADALGAPLELTCVDAARKSYDAITERGR